jgi:hypothetical protein
MSCACFCFPFSFLYTRATEHRIDTHVTQAFVCWCFLLSAGTYTDVSQPVNARTLIRYQVTDPEQPADPAWPRRTPAEVGIASDHLPSNVTLTSASPSVVFIAVVHATLEPGIRTGADAARQADSELTIHRAEGAESLRMSHEESWLVA